MEAHEYANIFPMMTDIEFDKLCQSFAKHGYIQEFPILVYKNKILDGRNRFKACETVGILPMFTEFGGTDNQAFDLVDISNTRKHWTLDQLGFIALDYLAIEEERARIRQLSTLKQNAVSTQSTHTEKGRSAEKVGKKVGVSRKRVQRSKAVATKSPELAEKVKSGELRLKDAEKKITVEKKKQERAVIAQAGKDLLSIPDNIQIFHGDFRNNNIPDNSIDLIFTDPPYDKKSIPLYKDLAEFGARVLRPGGSLITYVGHYAIGKVYNLMDEYLRYWWTLAVKHSGASRKLVGVNVIVEWKPMLWFVKETRDGSEFVRDLLTSDAPDKKEHEWQQGHTEADYYIEHLTQPEDIVVDPFMGSGTTLISALKLGRKSIGFEVDEERYYVAKQHISNNS